MKCLFAHGFEGVPNGHKPRYLREQLGYEVTAPFMPSRGWSLEDHVSVLLEAIDADPELRLVVGSSFGAFALSIATTRRPERDFRVVLMAPAVGIHEVWAKMLGPEGLATWEEMGSLQYHHKGVGGDVQLPWSLWTQCKAFAGVALSHPTAIVHGLTDDTIPVESAVALAKASPGLKRFYAVPDGHRLLESLHVMAEAAELVLA